MRGWLPLLPLLLASTIATADVGDLEEGVALARAGQAEPAIVAFTRAIESGLLPTELLAVAYNNRGVVYGALGDFDRAIGDYRRASALGPEDATTRRNLARAHSERGYAHAVLGDLVAALEDYDEALRLYPADARTLLRRALAHELAKEPGRARADLAAALVLDPDLPEARALAARLEGDAPDATAGAEPAPAAASSGPAATGDGTHVAVNDVNYRSGPGNSYDRLGTLANGARVTVVGETRGWYAIELAEGGRGFVYGTYLRPAD